MSVGCSRVQTYCRSALADAVIDVAPVERGTPAEYRRLKGKDAMMMTLFNNNGKFVERLLHPSRSRPLGVADWHSDVHQQDEALLLFS